MSTAEKPERIADPQPRKRGRATLLRCSCGHAKSIHARMYANQNLGTECNYPECRCREYRSDPKPD